MDVRRKGHVAERFIRNKFLDFGFEKCITTRFGSKIMDNSKIDLMNIPFNIQIKAGKQTALNPHKIFFEMRTKIKENFIKESDISKNLNLIIHKKNSPKGKKSNKYTIIVNILLKDFINFIKNYKENINLIEKFREKKCKKKEIEIEFFFTKIKSDKIKLDLSDFIKKLDDNNKLNIIIHEKIKKKSCKIIYMTFEDFIKIINNLETNIKKINKIKKYYDNKKNK